MFTFVYGSVNATDCAMEARLSKDLRNMSVNAPFHVTRDKNSHSLDDPVLSTGLAAVLGKRCPKRKRHTSKAWTMRRAHRKGDILQLCQFDLRGSLFNPPVSGKFLMLRFDPSLTRARGSNFASELRISVPPSPLGPTSRAKRTASPEIAAPERTLKNIHT